MRAGDGWPGLEWLVVVDLGSVVRERAVLATVADAIVAAAVGKRLCIAVTGPDSELAFVGHLTRALHARGRACRCLVSQPNPPGGGGQPRADDNANDSTVMVITSGAGAPGDHDVCRVKIHVTTDAPATPAEGAPVQGAGDLDADREPDIFLDYHDPSGPTIRHMAPRLSRPPVRP